MQYADARRLAAAFNAHEGHLANAAASLKVPTTTFKDNIARVRKKWPKLLKSFGTATRAGSASATDANALAAWTAFQDHGYSYAAASRSLEITEQTLKGRVASYARKHHIVLDALRPKPTLADAVEGVRNSEAHHSARAQLKDAAKRIAELEDTIKDLQWASRASFSPADWALPSRTPKKREHMPYLLTSDFQIGEVIRADETEAGYGYDSDIFRRRYRRMIDTTIYLSTEHAGSLWKYPGIIYARGGDTIDGGIHEELRDTADMTPIEAVECAFEEESAGITKLADAFGKVEVKSPGAAGNHDRIDFKPRTKRAVAHSYDRLIAFMLAHHFRADPRVTFQTSKSFDVRFPIYNRHILLTHGDRIGSSGGQGFIGPAATILRGWQKVIMEQQALGFPVDEVHNGHFHTPFWMPWGWSNGCMPGYSEYAKSYRMRPTPPIQLLGYYHHLRGVVDVKPIVLTEA